MIKLYQTLEQVFKMRINSNSEIIPYIKKLSEMGKFDEPKKVAAIAILLDRLGKFEDEAEAEKSIYEIAYKPPPPLIDPIEKEIDTGRQVQEETILQSTDSPMSGVSDQITDESPTESTIKTPVDDNTVAEFTPENITDTPDSTTAT